MATGTTSSPETSITTAATDRTLKLKLLVDETGAPLALSSATIFLHNEDGLRTFAVTTDANGQALLQGLKATPYALQARCGQFLPVHQVLRLDDAEERSIELRFLRGNDISGIVIDENGAPLVGAQVRAVHKESSSPNSTSARTSETGHFRLPGLQPGEWSILGHAEGFRRHRLETTLPDDDLITLRLRSDPGFEVVVVDATGTPVTGARVALISRTYGLRAARSSALTSATGRARLWGLPGDDNEALAIKASARGFVPASRTVRALEVAALPVELVLLQTTTISGHVVDGSGTAVANAEVLLEEEGEQSARKKLSLRTTAAGAFHLKDLAPGKYVVFATTSDQGASVPVVLEVGASAPADTTLTLTLIAGDGSVAGRVIDLDGKPVSLCPVQLLPAATAAHHSTAVLKRRVTTGVDGVFRFGGLVSSSTDGKWQVTAGGGRTAHASLEVSLGDQSIELVAPRLSSIVGLVSGLDDSTNEFAIRCEPDDLDLPGESTGIARTQRFSSRSGWFKLRSLPPGSYRLTAQVGGESRGPSTTVKTRPGEETGPVELWAGE